MGTVIWLHYNRNQSIFLTLRFDCVYITGLVSSGKCRATMGVIFEHTVTFFCDSYL